MRREAPRRLGATLGLATAFGLLAFALPASAGPVPLFDNQYEGKVERNNFTYLGFDVVGQGTKKAARITAALHYSCTSGAGGRAAARARGRLRIKDGAFSGEVSVPKGEIPVRAARARGAQSSMTYKVSCKLRPGGRARGKIDAEIRFEGIPRGIDPFRCYSGRVDWRARRGADVEPEPSPI
jgi:hypothetical protein